MTARTRKILIGGGAALALLVALLFLLPLLFGGRIAARVRSELNQSVDARVDWGRASLGLLRNFPNLTLALDDLTVVGEGAFAADTLAAVDELRVVLDLPSAIRSALGGSAPVIVRAVELGRPRLSLIVLRDGTANWDIVKEQQPDTGAARALAVSLRRFAIEDGLVNFDSRAANLQARLAGITQTLSGDFGAERFDIDTRARIDTATVEFAGIRYLDGVRLELTAGIDANTATRTFTLREGSGVRLNELLLAVAGSVAGAGDRSRLDLAFEAPSTDFRDILSLVPAVYSRDFASVRTTGTVAVSGRVQGEYGDDAFPAFALDATVAEGAFQYPDLPLPARDIFLDLAITNPGGSPDSTVVNLERFRVVLGRNPITASLVMRTPVSDPEIDARFAGTLDLADLARTVKLDSVQELTGTISADAAVRTRMSWVDEGQYDRVAASGAIDVRNLTAEAEALRQPIAIREASLRLAPRRTELRSFDATIGSSDLRAAGSLDNLLGYLLRDEELRGTAQLTSNRFVLDEWRSDDSELNVIPVPPGLDFTIDATVVELVYDRLAMTNARGRVRIKDERLTLENFALNTLGGTISVDGFYETTTPARPTFDVGMRLYQLDIPSAFEAFTTVQQLAPVARYAQGSFSTDLRLSGPLGLDMMPVFSALTGRGSLQTSQLQIRDFPPLERLASATKVALLNDPALRAIQSQFEIRDGRLHVQPFSVGMGEATLNVTGSNGIDQSLDYQLGLQLPGGSIGQQASQAIGGLISRAGGSAAELAAASQVTLAIGLTGTVTNPAIRVNLADAAGTVAGQAGQAVEDAAEQRVDAAVDSARLRAAAEAQRLVAEAEERAAAIRAEAKTLADRVRQEGNAQADSLVARASGPIERAAATAAAERLKAQTESRAAGIEREADRRASALVAEAQRAAGTP